MLTSLILLLENDDNINWEDIGIDLIFLFAKFLTSVVLVSSILFGFFDLVASQKSFKFSDVYKPVIIGNLIFLFPLLLLFLWFTLIQPDYTFEDLRAFKPFYLIGYLDTKKIPSWLSSVLSIINLYEILFILIVSFGIKLNGFKMSFKRILLNTSLVYIVLLLAWEGLFVYLLSTVN